MKQRSVEGFAIPRPESQEQSHPPPRPRRRLERVDQLCYLQSVFLSVLTATIRGAVEQGNHGYNIRGLEQVPRRQGLFGLSTNSDGEAMLLWQLGLAQGAEHIWDHSQYRSSKCMFCVHDLPSSVESSPRQSTKSGASS